MKNANNEIEIIKSKSIDGCLLKVFFPEKVICQETIPEFVCL
jgi:hypothetical protein